MRKQINIQGKDPFEDNNAFDMKRESQIKMSEIVKMILEIKSQGKF